MHWIFPEYSLMKVTRTHDVKTFRFKISDFEKVRIFVNKYNSTYLLNIFDKQSS